MITGEFFVGSRETSGRETYRAGGLALAAVSAARPEPIPVIAEMSSVNPVFLMAIERFLRPVCYQDVPDALLPETLRDGDAGFERLVDGVRVGPDGERAA